jgi:hypothetical protein
MQRGEKSMRKKHERQPSCIEGGIWEKGCKWAKKKVLKKWPIPSTAYVNV